MEAPPTSWYYLKPDQSRVGPLSTPELAALIMNSEVTADTQIWTEAFGQDWKAVSATPEFADTLIAADIAYEDRFFQPILNTFDRLLKPDGHIMMGEPNRPFAKPFFDLLQQSGWEFISVPFTVPGPTPVEITLYDIRRAC